MRALKAYEVHLVFVGALYLLGLAVYSNTLNGPFIFDDYPNIRDNPSIRMTVVDIDSLYRAGFESISDNRALANISFALNYYFGSYEVFGFHLVNLLVHIVNGVLVYFLVVALGRATDADSVRWRWVAFMAGAIFLAHPVQTQAVTYIVQRMTSLATLFYLLALLLYVQGRQSPVHGKRWALWCFALLAGLCASATKEIALTLPLAIVLWEWYFPTKPVSNGSRRCLLALLAAAGGSAALALLYLGAAPLEVFSGLYERREFSMMQRLMTETRVMIFYLGLLVWPTPARLNLLHEMSLSYGLLAPPSTLICTAVLVGLGSLGMWLKRTLPVISFAILWFLLHSLLESSVVGLELVYEHRLYLPLMGVSLGVAYAISTLLARYRVVAAAIGLGLIVFLGSGAYLRNAIWQDRLTLWVDVVTKSPDIARARNNLGRALVDKGRHDGAVTQFTEALFLQPDFAQAHNNLGVLLATEHRFSESLYHFRQALLSEPSYAQAQHNYARTLYTLGRKADAIEQLRAALKSNPDYANAHITLASVLQNVGDTRQACEHVEAARRLHPRHAGVVAALEQCAALE